MLLSILHSRFRSPESLGSEFKCVSFLCVLVIHMLSASEILVGEVH